MNLDISKVFVIQSHEWGGQLILSVFNGALGGITLATDELASCLEVLNNIDFYRYENYKKLHRNYGYLNYFTLIPLPIVTNTNSQTQNLKNIGSYYLGLCNHSWTNGVTFNLTHIIVKSDNGFIFKTYDSSTTYDTTWNIINIPNVVNPPNVFLLKMFKENDAENGKYLTANIDRNANVGLSFSNSISRNQLWNLNSRR